MAVQATPCGYHSVTPYLIVEGAETLIEFLCSGLAATEICRHLNPDGSIMHAEVKIGDSFIMIGEAKCDDFKAMPSMIYLYVENADATYEQAIQAGATSLMEPKDQFYGDRTGGVKDTTGNFWWIATHQEDVSPAEIEKRIQALPNR